MTLAALQQAIAELICDRNSLRAYEIDRSAWLRSRRLDPEDADILRELDQASLRAFHDIHARDRAYFIEAILPLTIARLGEGWWKPYFGARPYGDDETRTEVQKFASWLEATSLDLAAVSLARFEQAKFALLDEPPFDPAPGNILRDPTAARLTPGLAVVETTVHIPTLLEDPSMRVGSHHGIVLLRRDEDGVTTAWIEGVASMMLLAIARHDRETMRSLLATRRGQEAYLDILSQGALV